MGEGDDQAKAEAAEKAAEKGADKGKDKEPFPTKASETRHEIELGGATLRYLARADWLTLTKKHTPLAKVFHVAYLVDDPSGTRPLTFVFNGGPGAASAYLHMGALGPARVAFGAQGALPPPPTRLVPNTESWLAFTDLCFIDPVGTGFSRALDRPAAKGADKDAKLDPELKENPEFWEVDRDLDSLGDFIAAFLSRHGRWTRPIFLAGESYGGFRVAKMARKLQQGTGVGLSGAILISPAIELSSLTGTDYDIPAWVERVPSMAAAARHHGRAAGPKGTLQETLRAAESFAGEELAVWLLAGERLPEARRQALARRMADLIGLPAEVIARAGGRIDATRFCRELLRSERLLCGHYDASVTSVDPFPDRDRYEGPDPTLFSLDRLFTAAINHHLRAGLGVDTELDYRLLSFEVNASWKDKSTEDRLWRSLIGAMDDLRYGMSLNPHMRVFITHGYYDLVTPYYASNRLVDLMKLDDRLRAQLRIEHFEGGHMFYTWDASREALHRSMAGFYGDAVAPASASAGTAGGGTAGPGADQGAAR